MSRSAIGTERPRFAVSAVISAVVGGYPSLCIGLPHDHGKRPVLQGETAIAPGASVAVDAKWTENLVHNLTLLGGCLLAGRGAAPVQDPPLDETYRGRSRHRDGTTVGVASTEDVEGENHLLPVLSIGFRCGLPAPHILLEIVEDVLQVVGADVVEVHRLRGAVDVEPYRPVLAFEDAIAPRQGE